MTGNGRALYLCGYGGPGIGVKLPSASETGDLTSSHRLWADPPKGQNQNPQRIGSGQILGDHLYVLNEPGVMQCSEVATGKILWRERLGANSWSSMNLIGNTLYVNDTRGTTYLIEPDPTALKLLGKNDIDPNQHTNASLAFANGRIYLRTDAHLYAIE
jgi:outer membrane protein assembly factor BamB